MNPRRFFSLIALGGLVAAGALYSAADARADTPYLVTEMVAWTGAPCIQIRKSLGGIDTECGGIAQWQYQAYLGEPIGVDPIMGNADAIACSVALDGWIAIEDAAVHGDGTDVTCLGVV